MNLPVYELSEKLVYNAKKKNYRYLLRDQFCYKTFLLWCLS